MAFRRLTNGCCVRLSGVVKESIGPGQDREFLVDGVEYLGGCDPEVRSLFCFSGVDCLF